MAQWTVSTHYKKSCQEVENWVRSNGDGRITVVNGFRYGEWIVYTTDDNMPEFEFVEVPGGDGKKDSINLLDCEVNNIESVELVEMYDGGCWYDVEVEGLDEETEEEIRDFIDENSTYDLEEREDDPWYNEDSEWWVWGPIAIKNEAGDTVRIIVADDEGNVIDFKEEE
jgi:hypothetical protein